MGICGGGGRGRRHKMKCTPVRINTCSSRSLGNGSVYNSSNSNSTNSCLANGGLPQKVNNYLSNDSTSPPEGIPSQ